MSKFRVTAYDDQAAIDLSPMLDVVFILLIFFIIVATFVEESGLPLNLPESSDAQPPSPDAIRITVEEGGRYVINGRVVVSANVRPYLQALHSEHPKAIPTVFLARGSLVRDAALAMDAVHGIGVEVIPIVALD